MTIEKMLNQQIANWNVLYTKLHNFHWYVKGPDFFTLHAKFEELYDEAASTIDELAERLLMVGGKPIATLKQYLENATLKENTEALNAEGMVQNIVSDFELMITDLKAGIEVAEQSNDQVTADQLLGLVSKLEKHNWMLNSFLGK
jgi:starvation-inducible DNA-binding protein